MVNVVDLDGTAIIHFPEFLKMMCIKVDADNSEDQIREAFRLFDQDGNGFISRKELAHVMTYLGMSITPDEIELHYS